MKIINYLKYFISPLTMLIAVYMISLGEYYPMIFLLSYSLFMILGDSLMGKDVSSYSYSYPRILDFALYLNLPLLLIFIFMVVALLSPTISPFMVSIFKTYLFIDLLFIKNSITIIDKICLIEIIGLFIGIMGTVPGHELTHRKKSKLDMFIGNWLLAISWDCTFAVEHVYGHHKNVCLDGDPATAKRGENIYAFIFRAIIKEQKDAWKIEIDHLKRRDYFIFGMHNKMLIGYLRSILLTFIAYLIGGWIGLVIYLFFALYGKYMLEAVNFIEHYGLVREEGKPVYPRHSWNSNNILSSLYLYNLPRHSSHHEKANLKFWELKSYEDAPTMPYGYLSMVYLIIFLPFLYHRIMAKKLLEWDEKYATDAEKKLAGVQNKNSGIKILKKYSY
tara:strand:- start:74 stop:1243 length:1170 start_codon:yes stop_codon:yes gene_type:complete